jgi:2'-5' RNA ligase
MSEHSNRTDAAPRRIFFALWPNEALQRLVERQTHTQVEESGGRPVPAHNLHLTLAFLGSIEAGRVETTKACGAAVGGEPAFDMSFDRLEVWPRSHVLCLATQTAPTGLTHLVERLRFNLLKEGFEVRQEDFRPHLTLARDVRKPASERPIASIGWRVNEFVLMQSQPAPTGSQYSFVARWALSTPAVKEIA